MDFKKIEIELNDQEIQSINNITFLQEKMKGVDPEKLNGQLFASIKEKALGAIASALGAIEIVESYSKNGLDLENEYKDYMEWEKQPSGTRSKEYRPKNIHPDEFRKFMEKTNDLAYDRHQLTGDAYKNTINVKKAENPEGFICAYSGKFYRHGEKYDYEHVISAHEISQDRVLNYISTIEERRELTNSSDNIVVVGRELNQSLGKTKAGEKLQWGEKRSKKDATKTNKEYHQTDDDRISSSVDKSLGRLNDFKEEKKIEYSVRTKGKIIVGNVATGAAKAAVGKLLSITVTEIINEYQNTDEKDIRKSIANITNNIKVQAKDVLDAFKNHSINGFVSALVDTLLNSLFKIAKNIFKFIKTAFSSILSAIKMLISSDLPWQERIDEALKILGAAVVGLIGIALEELLEKALVSALPFTLPFAGLISSILSGLIVGVGSVLVLQAFQKYQGNIEFRKYKGDENSELEKKAKINLAQLGIDNVHTAETVIRSIVIFDATLPLITSFKEHIDQSLIRIKDINLLITDNVDQAGNTIADNDDLLNLIENA